MCDKNVRVHPAEQTNIYCGWKMAKDIAHKQYYCLCGFFNNFSFFLLSFHAFLSNNNNQLIVRHIMAYRTHIICIPMRTLITNRDYFVAKHCWWYNGTHFSLIRKCDKRSTTTCFFSSFYSLSLLFVQLSCRVACLARMYPLFKFGFMYFSCEWQLDQWKTIELNTIYIY